MIPRFLFLFLFSTVAFAQTHDSLTSRFGNVDYLTQQQLKDYLTFMASDELQGRDTPSNGLNTAAKFIATLLSRWGVEPKGDNGTYFQNIDLLKSVVRTDRSSVTVNGESLSFGNGSAGVRQQRILYSGEKNKSVQRYCDKRKSGGCSGGISEGNR